MKKLLTLLTILLSGMTYFGCGDNKGGGGPVPTGEHTLATITPDSGPVNTSIIVTGTNFGTIATDIKVIVGSKEAKVTNVTATSITATIPSDVPEGAAPVIVTLKGANPKSGTLSFKVTGSGGTSGTLSVTDFTPKSAKVGEVVTISGKGFGTTPTIKFNGAAAILEAANTDTEVKVKVPTGATSGKITITAGTNNVETAAAFTVTTDNPQPNTPNITSIKNLDNPTNPTKGISNDVVEIIGTNFGTNFTDVKVNFGTEPATVNALDNGTKITIRVPATTDKTEHVVKITVTIKDKVSNQFDFTYQDITGFEPIHGMDAAIEQDTYADAIIDDNLNEYLIRNASGDCYMRQNNGNTWTNIGTIDLTTDAVLYNNAIYTTGNNNALSKLEGKVVTVLVKKSDVTTTTLKFLDMTAITADGTGNIYIANKDAGDNGNDEFVMKVSSDGMTRTKLSGLNSYWSDSKNYKPVSLAYANGKLYIGLSASSTNDMRVIEYDLTGNTVTKTDMVPAIRATPFCLQFYKNELYASFRGTFNLYNVSKSQVVQPGSPVFRTFSINSNGNFLGISDVQSGGNYQFEYKLK